MADIWYIFNRHPNSEAVYPDEDARLAALARLLARKPRVYEEREHRHGDGCTPLMRAAESSLPRVVAALLAAGADPNVALSDGRTALHWAAQFGDMYWHPADDLATVRVLLATGADPNATEGHDTALHCAVFHYTKAPVAFEIISTLLEAGADPNRRGRQGRTPLHYATTAAATKLLLDAGADIAARDDTGCTPLVAACADRHDEVVAVLLARGSDVRSTDEKGRAALHNVALTRTAGPRQIRRLVEAGADPNQPDADGRTPLHIAAGVHIGEMATILVKLGARLDAVDHAGMTPLALVEAGLYLGPLRTAEAWHEVGPLPSGRTRLMRHLRKLGATH